MMKITKFEQSGFVIEAQNGYKLALDIGSYTPLEKLSELNIDSMLVSHIHGDHFSPGHIKTVNPKKLYINSECYEALSEESLTSEIVITKSNTTINIEGIGVMIFEVDHGPNVKIRPKENFGFLIEVDGIKIYFGGDIFYPSGMDVSDLVVDYALLPVGTFYTFGPEEALNFARKFKKIGRIISMHYEKEPQTREQFIELANIEFKVE